MDGQTILQIVVSLITVLGGGGTIFALFRIRAERENLQAQTETQRADAATKLVKTSLELLAPVESRTQELEVQLARNRSRVKELEDTVDSMNSTIRTMRNTLEEERYRSQQEVTRLNAQVEERQGLVNQLAANNEELRNIKDELARIQLEYQAYKQRNPEEM
jgi:predicted RNase H-like nuclease (RuvC/YqgF family)